jgi:hypothetical protein
VSALGRPYAPGRPRWLALAGRPEVRWLSAAFALALGLRLIFALAVSRVQLVWDAASYWSQTQQIRATGCYALGYCDPGSSPAGGVAHAVDTVFFSKNGLLPLLDGVALSVLPNTVTSALVLFAILDALACVMIAVIVLRLGGPLWAAVLAAVLAGVYVPGIIGDGSFLQQPLIRFGLTATAFGYACALTSERHRRAWVIAGTCALAVVAFSSQTTRPLMWAVAAAVIAIAASSRATRDIARMQLQASVVLGVLVVAGMVLIAVIWPAHSLADAVTNVGLGLSTSGTATGQVTVLSFPHFWPTDAWPFFADSNTTGTLFGDFAGDPVRFVGRLLYGTYANWRYPDLLYFQEFGLGRGGQVLQHLLLVIPGFAGLAWLIGQSGRRRLVGAVVLVIALLISLLAGLVSVEPRRVGALVPLLALGAACFVWSLSGRRAWGRRELLGGAALTACALAWLVSLPALLSVLPLAPVAGHLVLVLARTAAVVAAATWLLLDWRRRWDGFAIVPPAALGAALVLLVLGSELSQGDWRAWSTTIREPVRQQVDGLRLSPGLQPWLAADFGSPRDAAAAAIYVDGRLVKPAGQPMRRWQADGEMLRWPPYEDLARMGAAERPRTWMAIPLDRETLSGGRATIEVRPPRGGIALAGDYAPNGSSSYDGPALDPFFGGLSLWRWIWNGREPRIPVAQDLGARYTSSRDDGRYRLYISQQPFGSRTNVLQGTAATPVTASTAACPGGTRYATTADGEPGNPWLCQQTGGGLTYHLADGTAVGTSTAAALAKHAPRGSVVDRVTSSKGSVELVSGGGPLLIANLRSPGGELLYSLGFSYPAVLPTYT